MRHRRVKGSFTDAFMWSTHMHTAFTECMHTKIRVSNGSDSQTKMQWREKVRQRAVREREKCWWCDWALVIFGSFSTIWMENLPTSCSTVWHQKTHRERGSVKERKRRSHTFQSQRAGQTPQTIKARWPCCPRTSKHCSAPLAMSAGPAKASLHSLHRTDTP